MGGRDKRPGGGSIHISPAYDARGRAGSYSDRIKVSHVQHPLMPFRQLAQSLFDVFAALFLGLFLLSCALAMPLSLFMLVFCKF